MVPSCPLVGTMQELGWVGKAMQASSVGLKALFVKGEGDLSQAQIYF